MRIQLDTVKRTISVNTLLKPGIATEIVNRLLPCNQRKYFFLVIINPQLAYLSPIWVNPDRPWIDEGQLVDGIYNIEYTDL